MLCFGLAWAIEYFRHLKAGLSLVLAFVGVKTLVDPHGRAVQWFQVEIPTRVSLSTAAAIILASVALPVTAAQRENKAALDQGSQVRLTGPFAGK